MESRKILFAFALLLFLQSMCLSQRTVKAVPTKTEQSSAFQSVTSSPAYAEVLLKKTELQSELESLVIDYTEDYPKVVEIRYSLTVLQKASERMLAVKAAESSKLTLALGKLIVRKIELETDLWSLQKNYKDDHPDVKRAKRKVEIYEAAIKEILG